MNVRRKMKQSRMKVDRKFSGVKRKVVKKRSVVAAKPRRLARTPGKRARQGASSLKRKTTGAMRASRSKAREAGKAVGTFLGKAFGNAERLINITAENAKGFLN